MRERDRDGEVEEQDDDCCPGCVIPVVLVSVMDQYHFNIVSIT